MRPALYALDGRALPVIRNPCTTASDMTAVTGGRPCLFRDGRGVTDGIGDAPAQRLGHLLTAAMGDDHPQLGLEVVGLVARGAVVEVVLDEGPPLVGQLAVEEV